MDKFKKHAECKKLYSNEYILAYSIYIIFLKMQTLVSFSVIIIIITIIDQLLIHKTPLVIVQRVMLSEKTNSKGYVLYDSICMTFLK